MASLDATGSAPASHRRAFRISIQFIAVATFIAAMLYCISPLKDLVRSWNDFAFVYAAGRAWLKSGSPYDVKLWQAQWADIYPSFAGIAPPIASGPTQPYLYPPHWAIVAVPLALLRWPVACRIWDACNVIALVALTVMCLRLLARDRKLNWHGPWLWFCLAVAASNGAVRWALWECQLSLVPTLGVIGAYWAWTQRFRSWVVVFAFIALLKPQIGLLPLFYLALNGALVWVTLGGILAVGVGGLALAQIDWGLLPEQLRECTRLHLSISYNAYDYFYSFSAILARFGSWSFLSLVIGVATLAGFAFIQHRGRRSPPRHSVQPLSQLSLACAVTVAFVPLHGYDLVLLTPIALWAYGVKPRWIALLLSLLVVVAARTHQWGTRLGLHPLAPWSTLAVAVVVAVTWVATARNMSRVSCAAPSQQT